MSDQSLAATRAEVVRLRAINAELRGTNTTLALNGLNLKASNAELLAALKAAKRLCDNMNEFGACTDAEIYDAADTAIRAAIAKAKGE